MFASDILPIQNSFFDCKAENISQIKNAMKRFSCMNLTMQIIATFKEGIDGLSWSHDSVIEVSKKNCLRLCVFD